MVVQALAVAAAFPELVGAVRIEIAGDVEATLAGLLEDLASLGVSPDDLPTVELMAGEAPLAAHVGALPATLAASCEYERRSWTKVFPVTTFSTRRYGRSQPMRSRPDEP